MNKFRTQILLPQIGKVGQEKIINSKILIVGLGGLAAPLVRYLASNGVGNFAIIDDDIIEEDNLARQNNFLMSDLGKSKIDVTENIIQTLNPQAKIKSYYKRVNKLFLQTIINDYDIIIDASDNFTTKFICNDLALQHKKIFISGSFIGFNGYMSVYKSAIDKSKPCFRCFHHDDIERNNQKACFKQGVYSIGVGIIGMFMASETIKEIIGIEQSLAGKMIICDFLSNNHRTVSLKKRSNCFCGKIR